MDNYEISLEVAGPAAMWTRPDTGATPISYPVPTWSAAKGMFEAVLRRPQIHIYPTWIEICKPVRFERYVTNYGGPLRKTGQIKDNNNYQLMATILVDVSYRIHAEVRAKKMSTRGKKRPVLRERSGKDWRPQFKGLFEKRLGCGQTFYTPCLGWKEFVPSYFGPLRPDSRPDPSVDDISIPSLLHSMWDNRKLKPKYVQNWHIVKGIMSYHSSVPEEKSNVE